MEKLGAETGLEKMTESQQKVFLQREEGKKRKRLEVKSYFKCHSGSFFHLISTESERIIEKDTFPMKKQQFSV